MQKPGIFIAVIAMLFLSGCAQKSPPPGYVNTTGLIGDKTNALTQAVKYSPGDTSIAAERYRAFIRDALPGMPMTLGMPLDRPVPLPPNITLTTGSRIP